MSSEGNMQVLQRYLQNPCGLILSAVDGKLICGNRDKRYRDDLVPDTAFIQWGSRSVGIQVAGEQAERIKALAEEAIHSYMQAEINLCTEMMEKCHLGETHALYALRDVLISRYGIKALQQLSAIKVREWVNTNPAAIHRVTGLTLINRGLQIIPSAVGAFEKLTHLNCWNNKISTISREVFRHLPCLTHLDLSNNWLTHIPWGAFHELSSLRELNLSENARLNYLPVDAFDHLPSLQILNLSANSSLMVPMGLFMPLSGLQILDLSENPGLIFSWGMLCGLSNLKELIISWDQTPGSYPHAFSPLQKLETLRLLNFPTGAPLTFLRHELGINSEARIERCQLPEPVE